ncbi:MAG: hypothetical protein IJO27_01255 [Bacilli bacterium]|nr:hypothetical protein [Bacilli bacterium]MBQ7030842.1 hypothetical protein [Bacilli bacterium]
MKKSKLFYLVFFTVLSLFIFINKTDAKTITVHYNGSSRVATYNDIRNFMGYKYTVNGYNNQGNGSALNQMQNSAAFVVHNHGAAGRQQLDDSGTGIAGKGGNGTTWKNISSLSTNASKPLYIAIFYGCNTGTVSSTYGNITSQTTSKIAKAAVAWTISTYVVDVNLWNQYFFNRAKNNMSSTASAALTYADTTLAAASGAINATGMKNNRVTSGNFGWTFTQMSL